MACTTILVGKKASYDGSTLIARNDDSPTGIFNAKKLVVVEPRHQPRHYESKIAHLKIELPDNPLSYTAMPSVDTKEGVWAASGINSANVAMTATETITTNDRVLGADPLVKYVKGVDGKADIAGGIGEEDLVVITLPYIHSAKEGALRLGALLEKYGTYESNGIAFSDKDEIWWLESIGGHHWIAKRVPDDTYITMPNQFGLDNFDLDDAFSKQKENLCSPDLKDFINDNHLNLNLDGKFNPRLAFGSHSDSDHVYNTPRAWYIERYLNPRTCKWDGEEADFTPLSDDIPWARVPERKITVSDVKYLLSSHFQGTKYDPYAKYGDPAMKGAYRPIGISRTSFMSVAQIRPDLPEEIQAIEWICFGSNPFNALVPLYTNVKKIPAYYNNTTLTVSTDNFYWASRLIGALADSHFNFCSALIERYQDAVMNQSNALINKYDVLFTKENKLELLNEANELLSEMAHKETDKALNNVLYEVSCHMKNGYSKSDN
ncbi:MAG: C69 family dipeptidase [Bacilli bacterium]